MTVEPDERTHPVGGERGITAYLYDSEGRDRQVDPVPGMGAEVGQSALLWVDVARREMGLLAHAAEVVALDRRSLAWLEAGDVSPRVANFGNYLQFSITLPAMGERQEWRGRRFDFLVGDNWLLTVHDRDADFLAEFRAQTRADTQTGALAAAALSASLLDWHLEMYLRRTARIEQHLDELDEAIVTGPGNAHLLDRLLVGKRMLSRLRFELVAQRPVFYGLMRPDILAQVGDGAAVHYAQLGARFERAMDELEHTRQLVFASFDLLDSRLGQTTNDLVKALTFYTVVIGIVAAIAGLFGMNFDPGFFRSGATGFFLVLFAVLSFVVAAIAWARSRELF